MLRRMPLASRSAGSCYRRRGISTCRLHPMLLEAGGTLVWRASALLQSSLVSPHVSADLLKFLDKACGSHVMHCA
jgi:hypothetical protein